jgi:hypothetical protein
MDVHGKICVWGDERLYRNEGDANDEEAWNCIDESKSGKRRRRLEREKNTGVVACNGWGRR